MIEQQIKQYQALDKWFQSVLGLSVAHEFRNLLKPISEYLRGETLLQLGQCGTNSWLEELNFQKKWIASPFHTTQQNHLECAFNQIPLYKNSLDCVFVPLTLEPFGASYSLIDEVDRILKPLGFVVILSINPWSLWGGAMKCGLVHCYNNSPIKMRSSFTINRLFLQRGYRQCALKNFYYIPPINNKSLIKKLTFFDEVGKMIWPFPSGFYCYIAQKYEAIHPRLIIEPSQHLIAKKYDTLLNPATI